jgi:glycosyltransferase involved in cell wall biosynthesis
MPERKWGSILKIGMHLTTFNRLLFTKQCLQSLEWSEPKNLVLVVVDNNSTDGTKEFLKSYSLPYLKQIVFNDKNGGLGLAINQGWNILKDDCDILGQVNNDFLFEPGWESNVLACFEELNLGWIMGSVEGVMWGDQVKGPYSAEYIKSTTKCTPSGKGFYLPPSPGGAGFVLSQHWKNGTISISPRPFEKGYVGAGPALYNQLLKVKGGVRLGHPGILVRDSEYSKPEYLKYYDETFGVRSLVRLLQERRRNESKGYRGITWESFVKRYYPDKIEEKV